MVTVSKTDEGLGTHFASTRTKQCFEARVEVRQMEEHSRQKEEPALKAGAAGGMPMTAHTDCAPTPCQTLRAVLAVHFLNSSSP